MTWKSVTKAIPVRVLDVKVYLARHLLSAATQEYPEAQVSQVPRTEHKEQFVIRSEQSVQTADAFGIRSLIHLQDVPPITL